MKTTKNKSSASDKALRASADALREALTAYQSAAKTLDLDQHERDVLTAAIERGQATVDPEDDNAIHRLAAQRIKLDVLTSRASNPDEVLTPLIVTVREHLRALPDPLRTFLSHERDELLAAPSRTGEGVHVWLFRVARQLHAHLPAGEIVALLESAVAECGRHVPRSEIVAAVQHSLACAWQPSGQPIRRPASKWPSINQEQRAAITRDGGGLADLWELSCPRIEDSRPHAEEVIARLFASDTLLCCGKSSSAFETRPREQWGGELLRLALIVPSPMIALTGLTKEGRQSAHALSNTGPRRFLIVECDTGTTDEHATILIHLAGYAPMVCAVHSGGKSLHGWFFVEGQPDDRVLRFFRYAVSLGADPATWPRSQFVRMPDGRRDNGRRQTVYFLNFKPMEPAG